MENEEELMGAPTTPLSGTSSEGAGSIPKVGPSGEVPKLTKTQYNLLLYFEQHYWRTGSLPSYEVAKREMPTLEEEWFYEALMNPRFNGSLKSRGLPDHLFDKNDTIRHRIISEKQMQVANILMDTLDKRSKLKKLTELGISTQEYNQWLRDPNYRSYCLERAEAILLDAQPTAHLALVERVSQGDLGAIRYYNAMVGRYRERVGAGVEVNIQNTTILGDMLIQIVEIIQRHVKDPAALSAIGDEILALQAGTPLSGTSGGGLQMSGLPEFHKPEVIAGKVDYGI